jgi:hypothetical protein
VGSRSSFVAAVVGLVLGVVLTIVIGRISSDDGYLTRIDGYRLESARVITILVTAGIADSVEVRLTEATDTVTVAVRIRHEDVGPVPSIGLPYWVTATLYGELGSRRVVDHDGNPITVLSLYQLPP